MQNRFNGFVGVVPFVRLETTLEFQRDSISQPRVARNELPWVRDQTIHPTLKGLHPCFTDIIDISETEGTSPLSLTPNFSWVGSRTAAQNRFQRFPRLCPFRLCRPFRPFFSELKILYILARPCQDSQEPETANGIQYEACTDPFSRRRRFINLPGNSGEPR